MSINVKFYTCSDDPRTLPKTLVQTGNLAGYSMDVLTGCSILNPALCMAYDATLVGCNYIYIAEFGRYYAITITLDEGGRMYISGTVDAMQTFADVLGTCTGRVCRSESAGMGNVKDEGFPVDPSKEKVDVIRLSGSELSINAPVTPYYVMILK